MDFLNFVDIVVPLLLVSIAALISEFAGVMAVFLEGIINIGAFLTFALTLVLKNPIIATGLSIIICILLMLVAAAFTEKTKANPFLVGLSVNLFSSGIISLLSSMFYKTRGVLPFSTYIDINSKTGSDLLGFIEFAEKYSTYFGIFVILFIVTAMQGTKWGMRVRVTGEEPEVLTRYGSNPAKYRILSWLIPSAMGAVVGSIKVFKLASFVPNISSGIGWIGIAAVFLGRKRLSGVTLAAIVFSLANVLSIFLQGSIFNIPPTILLSLPYIISILLLTIIPSSFRQKKPKVK